MFGGKKKSEIKTIAVQRNRNGCKILKKGKHQTVWDQLRDFNGTTAVKKDQEITVFIYF